MIMGQMVSGPWAGAGLGGLEQGTDFNCTSTICYGVTKPGESSPGAVHQTFVNLQRAINRWSGKAGFTSVAVDGFIGAATVIALQKAGNALLGTLPGALATIAKNLFSKNLTKENVAANAPQLIESLNSAADKLEAGGSLPAPQTSTPRAPAVATTTTPSSPGTEIATNPAPSKGSSLIWWLLGGFAIVATAGIATVIVLKRRRRKGSDISMRPGRRSAGYSF